MQNYLRYSTTLLLFIGLIFLYSIINNAVAKPQADPVPGGIALLKLKPHQLNSSATFKNKNLARLTVDGAPHLLVGIPLNTKPGKHTVVLKDSDNQKEKISFTVKAKEYTAQYLTIKNKRKVNPYEKDMPRILSEKKRKTAAKVHWSNNAIDTDFIVPVDGRISSIFGLRRFFNNQPRRPHSGLDIAAPEGTPVQAIASGTVIESGDFFFSGNMVYLDHGQGLISMYAHLHEIKVKVGDTIKPGQIIGTVGETGRVTGPHLHLSVIANQTTVDPLLFLPQLSDKAAAYFKTN